MEIKTVLNENLICFLKKSKFVYHVTNFKSIFGPNWSLLTSQDYDVHCTLHIGHGKVNSVHDYSCSKPEKLVDPLYSVQYTPLHVQNWFGSLVHRAGTGKMYICTADLDQRIIITLRKFLQKNLEIKPGNKTWEYNLEIKPGIKPGNKTWK